METLELKHLAPYENNNIDFSYDNEYWLDFPEDINYKISNYGRVYSKTRVVNHNYGGKAIKNGRILKQQISQSGYLSVGLTQNYKTKQYRVSRLVALTFLDNPNNKPCVNHKDGNKLNNHFLNLEWNTHGENVRHAWDNGLAKKRYSYQELKKKLDIIMNYAHYDVKIKTPHGVGRIIIDQNNYKIIYEDNSVENLIKSIRFWGNKFKLILRNLSDLTKEIEINGEKFVPIEMLDKPMQSHLLDCLDELEMLENNLNILPLYVCEYLFKWHFDVFGLIGKGLAIDINTLNHG